MDKLIFLIDRNIADFYIETVHSITKFLDPTIYEIRDYESLKHLDIRDGREKNRIFYNFCTDHPLKEKPFKILSSRESVNPLKSQKICFNKIKSDMIFRRFRLPVPPAITTINPEEVRRFISNYNEVIFKERESCSGAGHFIADRKYAFVGEDRLPYELIDKNSVADFNAKIERKKLICRPPFYLQAFLMPDEPAVWRAYLIEGEIIFFSKRYRDKINGRKDYIINAARGAKYRLEEKMSAIECHVSAIKDMMADLKLKVATLDFIISENRIYFLEMDCDGIYTFICRGFKNAENYEEKYDLDFHIAKMLSRLIK